jgi:hypothetical protein
MLLTLAMLLGGAAVFAVTCYMFWLIGQRDRIGPRWRESLTMEVFWVTVILSGWAGGSALIVKSLADLVVG